MGSRFLSNKASKTSFDAIHTLLKRGKDAIFTLQPLTIRTNTSISYSFGKHNVKAGPTEGVCVCGGGGGEVSAHFFENYIELL